MVLEIQFWSQLKLEFGNGEHVSEALVIKNKSGLVNNKSWLKVLL